MVEGKLNFSTKFAFGVGQAGEGVFNSGLAFFLLFYYSQILELNPLLRVSLSVPLLFLMVRRM